MMYRFVVVKRVMSTYHIGMLRTDYCEKTRLALHRTPHDLLSVNFEILPITPFLLKLERLRCFDLPAANSSARRFLLKFK